VIAPESACEAELEREGRRTSILEPAEKEDVVLVRYHPMSRPCRGPDLRVPSLPAVRLKVERPKIAVVVEGGLVRSGVFTAVDPESVGKARSVVNTREEENGRKTYFPPPATVPTT
jgi:hypothetical protein